VRSEELPRDHQSLEIKDFTKAYVISRIDS
jgi:hypothetical protein